MKREVSLVDVRRAIADYMWTEGCSCCQNRTAHEDAATRLAEILDVPRYSDGSGLNFYKYRTKEKKK